MQGNLDKAVLLIQQGRYELARQELSRVLAAEPSHAQAHALMALAFIGQKEFDSARREAGRAIEAAPDEPFGHYVLARALYGENRLAKAREVVEQAIRLDPTDADYYWLLGATQYALRQLKAALDAVDQGLAQEPEHAGCGNLRALILREMKRKGESKVLVDGLLVSDPNNAQTHATKGWGSLEDKEYDKAKAHFREALRIDPNHRWAHEGYLIAVKAASWLYRWAYSVQSWVNRNRFIVSAAVGGTSIAVLWMIDDLLRINPFLTRRVIMPALAVPLVLLLLCFLVDPIYNLVLRMTRREPVMLSEQQVLVSNYTVVALLIAVVAAIGFVKFGASARGWAIAGTGLIALPAAVAAGKPQGKRWKMALYTLAMAVIGGAIVWLSNVELKGAWKEKQADKALVAIYILGTMGAAWLPKDREAVE